MKHYVHVAFATLGVLCATGSAQERSKFGLPGVTQPSQQVTLSVPVEGVLSELLVTEGTEVEAGQPIARLDDRIARAAVASAAMAGSSAAAVAASNASSASRILASIASNSRFSM